MTYPPPGGSPDPYQPSQPYGQPTSGAPDPYQPYAPPPPPGEPYKSADPYAAQASGQPYGQHGYSAPGYGAPGYGGVPYPGYPASTRTNGLAIASLVCSLAGVFTCVTAPVGVVLDHVAKRQIAQTGEGGEGMATAGLVVGYIITVLGVLGLIAWIGIVILAASQGSTS